MVAAKRGYRRLPRPYAGAGGRLKTDGLAAIELHVHDLRRSAHYQMRKAGIDSKTRRQIMGHKTGSMDDRYTIIDDEDLDAATEKMNAYQRGQGMMSEYLELKARIDTLTDHEFQRFVELRQGMKGSADTATLAP
jgi:hypothetical protein